MTIVEALLCAILIVLVNCAYELWVNNKHNATALERSKKSQAYMHYLVTKELLYLNNADLQDFQKKWLREALNKAL